MMCPMLVGLNMSKRQKCNMQALSLIEGDLTFRQIRAKIHPYTVIVRCDRCKLGFRQALGEICICPKCIEIEQN